MTLELLPDELDRAMANNLHDGIAAVLRAQFGDHECPLDRVQDSDEELLRATLESLRRWFDPIATGKRLRDEIGRLKKIRLGDSPSIEKFLVPVGPDRWLVTPEGVAALWLIRGAYRHDAGHQVVSISTRARREALESLTATYKSWNEQRLRGVAALLQSETATLRPTAAGLLFVLLINRNTDYSRRLPSPRDPAEAAEISRAISSPALAFAHALSGREAASERGLDLYRGWALGELARRLGEGLHQGAEGVWIDPEWELSARLRLREALAGRVEAHFAVESALSAYEAVRPVLNGLNLAFERPSYTRRICDELLGQDFPGSLS